LKFKVVELFAGVGGFRLGLEKSNYTVIWSNQWEPGSKLQHASLIYEKKFKLGIHTNTDIEELPTKEIPDHDVLVGGFPCQDYSVASTLRNSKGLIGKKGVLWWSIHRILSEKKSKPSYLILENVDRLIISPSNQKGRDFAVMLRSLMDLNYIVEWRVINAGEYGHPQRRRRVFILAYHKNSNIGKSIIKQSKDTNYFIDWLTVNSPFAQKFKVKNIDSLFIPEIELSKKLVDVSKNFNIINAKNIFKNSGIAINDKIITTKLEQNYQGKQKILKDLVLKASEVPEEFFIDDEDLEKWIEHKSAKQIERTTKEGFKYIFSEGNMSFPDDLLKPSRTIITSEGGKQPSRFKHVVKSGKRYRRLTPIELELLNEFPKNFTRHPEVSDSKRAFLMGNALVVGVITKIGKALYDTHTKTE
jgi:DNA (cytosine-5)-methyltransferase 1